MRGREFAFTFEIVHLAADHSSDGSGSGGQFGDQTNAPIGVEVVQLCQHFESEREQGISCQDGHGVAENLVAGGPAAAQIVIIERGKIVMDQRIGVNELKRTRGRFNAQRRIRNRLRGCDGEQRTNALPTGEEAVAHGAVDGGGILRLRGNAAAKRGFNTLVLVRDVLVDSHGWIMLGRGVTCRLRTAGPQTAGVGSRRPGE